MSMALDVWHYPPELPESGKKVIWISHYEYKRMKCHCGTWKPSSEGGKHTGTCIIRWAYMEDVMLRDIYDEWMSNDGRPIFKEKKRPRVRRMRDGCIEFEGKIYRPLVGN